MELIRKFNILPYEVMDADGNITIKSDKKVGSVMQTQENVMATLKGFEALLANLKKDTVLSDGTKAGHIFWKAAGTIAKPKGKTAFKYDKATDTFIKA